MNTVYRTKAIKGLACYLAVALLVIGFSQNVHAGWVASDPVKLPVTDREADLQKVQKALESKLVGERLKQYGLNPHEVQARLDQLNDSQLHEVALNVDQLKAGGFHGAVIFIAVVAIAAIVLIYLFAWHH